MTINKMNPEVKALWLEALESGEYKQCKGKLTHVAEDGSKSHCCLGVLSELGVRAGVLSSKTYPEANRLYYGDYEESATVPPEVMKWADLSSCNPDVVFKDDGRVALAHLNDEVELTFPEIAALIREQL